MSGPEAIGQAALARIHFPISQLDVKVVFYGRVAGRTGVLVYFDPKRINVYVHPAQNLDDITYILAAGLGYIVDFTLLNDAERKAWRDTRGLDPARPWYGGPVFSTPASDFAETFAYQQTGDASQFRSQLAPLPSPEQLDHLTTLMPQE